MDLGSKVHLICGPNGSGKTTILEAIHLLSGGRSFRTARTGDLISHAESQLLVYGRLSADGHQHQIGLEKTRRHTRFRLDGENVRAASTVVRLMPVLVLNTESTRLLDGGPSNRRALLDRLLFHVEPSYLELIRGYYHLLKQRNASLRRGDPQTAVMVWDEQLAERAIRINAWRMGCIEQLEQQLMAFMQDQEQGAFSLKYQAGWDNDESLTAEMQKSFEKDRRLGSTSVGPHRAEVKALVGDKPAKSVLSRGQMKLVVTALVAAMAHVMEKRVHRPPVILVDDLAAELDEASKFAAIQLLTAQKTQAFFTSIEYNSLIDHMTEAPRVFHVERGTVSNH